MGPEPAAADGEELALLDEVRREEQGQEDLGELSGLEVDRSDAHPDAGTVVLAPDHRHQGQEQQSDAEHADRPPVALQIAHPPHDHEGGHEGDDPDRDPPRLQAGQVLGFGPGLVEAHDEHVAQAVQEPGDGHEGGVGVGRQPADGDVGHELEAEHHGEERPDVGGDGRVLGERGQEVGPHRDERAEHDEAQLGVAADRLEHQSAWVVVVVERSVEPDTSSMSRSMFSTTRRASPRDACSLPASSSRT
jgi:hypothetical protein